MSSSTRAYEKDTRPPKFTLSKRRLTEELWQKAILHGREDRHVNAIFASLIGEIATSAAQPPSARQPSSTHLRPTSARPPASRASTSR